MLCWASLPSVPSSSGEFGCSPKAALLGKRRQRPLPPTGVCVTGWRRENPVRETIPPTQTVPGTLLLSVPIPGVQNEVSGGKCSLVGPSRAGREGGGQPELTPLPQISALTLCVILQGCELCCGVWRGAVPALSLPDAASASAPLPGLGTAPGPHGGQGRAQGTGTGTGDRSSRGMMVTRPCQLQEGTAPALPSVGSGSSRD